MEPSSDGDVVSQSKPITVKPKLTQIDFGYDHTNDFVVYPGTEDTTTISYSPDGNFINHRQSVTLIVRNGQPVPILCWLLLIILLLSIVVSIVIICCVCIRKARRLPIRKQAHRIPTHINGFSPAHVVGPAEMMPKYVSPAQSYSTQKLYQWCQQRELQQYKSLWTVNSTSGPTTITASYQNDAIENPNAYKTRSLPSKNKQRPVSSIEDLDELYSKVNFSKKLRNRMSNDEAAIIAFCRSKSQNLSQYTGAGHPKNDATIIYDERTAL